jgi:hypothetical protein
MQMTYLSVHHCPQRHPASLLFLFLRAIVANGKLYFSSGRLRGCFLSNRYAVWSGLQSTKFTTLPAITNTICRQ